MSDFSFTIKQTGHTTFYFCEIILKEYFIKKTLCYKKSKEFYL